jgi:uncharacterized protein YcbX
MTGIDIGQVVQLGCFPVKSMAGVAETALDLQWTGALGDRLFAFRKSTDFTRFPWLTGRDVSELVRYRAVYDSGTDFKRPSVRVTAPDGSQFDLTSPQLRARLSDAAGEDVELIQIGRGVFDAMPLSVIGLGTMDALAKAHGTALAIERFRPNIAIAGARETAWLGGALQFGDDGPRLRANCPIERCAMVTIDPHTGARDPSIQRTVAQDFGNRIGAYCVPERLGTIRVGDRVRLIR